jgi:hypothetical protein
MNGNPRHELLNGEGSRSCLGNLCTINGRSKLTSNVDQGTRPWDDRQEASRLRKAGRQNGGLAPMHWTGPSGDLRAQSASIAAIASKSASADSMDAP